MAYLCCDVCDQPISFPGDNHICGPDNIKALVASLRERAQSAEIKVDRMQNAVHMLLKELSEPLGDQPVNVSADWLRKLWDATENCWYKAKDADDFLVNWLAMQRLLIEAFHVFRSNRYGEHHSLLKKLENLHEACEYAARIIDYKGEFDMKPEDLVRRKIHYIDVGKLPLSSLRSFMDRMRDFFNKKSECKT